MELVFAKRPCQNVAQLFFAPNEIHLDQTFLNALLAQVILHLDVFTLFVEVLRRAMTNLLCTFSIGALCVVPCISGNT
jgi:hypothetical protein